MKKEKITILGHENPDIDSIVSGLLLEYYLNNHTNYQGEFVIPDTILDKDTISICKNFSIPYLEHKRLLNETDKNIILVDHHERKLKDKNIIGIIDHHPTTKNIKTNLYINKNISSTSTILVKGNEPLFSKKLIKLAILAAYVDTASFNSTKARKKDKLWVKKLEKEYNFNSHELYEAGLVLTDLSNIEEAAFTGLKKYSMKNKSVEVSYLQVTTEEKNKNEIAKIKEIIINHFLNNNLDVYILMIHNMESMKTTAYKIFKDGIEIDYYDKYTSRGNVIIPKLEKEIDKHNFETNKINRKTLF